MDAGEIVRLLPWIFLLIMVYILSRYGIQWRIKRACLFIIRELESQEAFAPTSAVPLPYQKKSPFTLGVRDFKPKALEDMVLGGIIGRTEEGKYYLLRRLKDILG